MTYQNKLNTLRIYYYVLAYNKLLERGSLSLVSTTEELLDRKVAVPVYKTENTAVGILHADHVAPFIRKNLAITSPTSGGRSVGIVRSRTQTMEFSLVFYNKLYIVHAYGLYEGRQT
jgi:hypothetical protein